MHKGARAAAVCVAAITGCGSAAAQEAFADAPPVAPAGLVDSLALPDRDADGWLTPNRGLSAAETQWHLRVALNVAALGCRGAGEAETVAGYNALLASEKAALSAAAAATAAAYKARAGATWQARYDDDMTRLYNFWARPAAHDRFCAVADAVLRDAAVVEPSDFAAFAQAALPRLEQPFLAFFDTAAAYRTALAAWRGARAPQVAVALAP